MIGGRREREGKKDGCHGYSKWSSATEASVSFLGFLAQAWNSSILNFNLISKMPLWARYLYETTGAGRGQKSEICTVHCECLESNWSARRVMYSWPLSYPALQPCKLMTWVTFKGLPSTASEIQSILCRNEKENVWVIFLGQLNSCSSLQCTLPHMIRDGKVKSLAVIYTI